MTSVPNHLPRLNGSSLWLCLVALFFIQCKTTKTVTNRPVEPTTQQPQKPKIDSVEWVEKENPKVIEIEPDIVVEKPVDLNPSMLGVILPLKLDNIRISNNQISSRDEAMIHYYTGVQLGLEKLKADGKNFHVILKDSEEDEMRVSDIMETFKSRGVSYVFGGKGRKEVESIANFAKDNGMLYASGWQVNSSFLGENANYIQFNPSFQAHAITVLKHAISEYNPEQIILFGSRREQSRIDEINRLYKELTNADELLETLVVESINELEQLEMEEWKLEDEDGNEIPQETRVFIAPITRNYNLIHDFFRFLDFNEMHERSVVYGITEWNSELLYDHLNNYDVRLSAPWNPAGSQVYSSFSESFFNRTGTLPEEKAYEGYNHIMLMTQLIEQANADDELEGAQFEVPGMKVELVDHKRLESPGTDRSFTKSYLENGHVHMLGFKDFRYFILPY